MGGMFGGYLARAGEDVVLIDVSNEAVEAINARGLSRRGQGWFGRDHSDQSLV